MGCSDDEINKMARLFQANIVCVFLPSVVSVDFVTETLRSGRRSLGMQRDVVAARRQKCSTSWPTSSRSHTAPARRWTKHPS